MISFRKLSQCLGFSLSKRNRIKFADLVASEALVKTLKSFSLHGIVVFKRPGTPRSVLTRWREESAVTFEDLLSRTAVAPGGFGLGKDGGFREIVNKDPGRFDMNLDHLGRADHKSPGQFISEVVRGEIVSAAGPLFGALFGPNYRQNGQGVVVSRPGTEAQGWHMDSSWLFQNNPSQPCHFVTCFVPLFDSSLEIGPTEFAIGSHALTHSLGRDTVHEQYPSAETVTALTSACTILTMHCAAGDVIVMDGRMLHRGLGNRSTTDRHLIYASFCPPWYREWPESQPSSRSLF